TRVRGPPTRVRGPPTRVRGPPTRVRGPPTRVPQAAARSADAGARSADAGATSRCSGRAASMPPLRNHIATAPASRVGGLRALLLVVSISGPSRALRTVMRSVDAGALRSRNALIDIAGATLGGQRRRLGKRPIRPP